MIKGFILAAGFSKRLRPISEYIPKPLLPVAGEVILEYVYRLLKEAGVTSIGVNLHYKAQEIENFVKQRNLRLKLFHERELLGTGGALWNARDFLKDSIFIAHNSDIYWDGNLREAIDFHINSGNSITLLVHDHREFNKLKIDRDGNFLGLAGNCSTDEGQNILAFTGVAVYSPQILELLPQGASSVIELWLKAEEMGFPVRAFKAKYSFWHDIGTPMGYAKAVFDKLNREFTSFYVSPDSEGCSLICPQGKVVVEGDVRILRPLKARNVIFLPSTEVCIDHDFIEESILCGKHTISIAGWQGESESLTCGGSQRDYIRVKGKVVCLWNQESPEFEKTIEIGRFLRKNGFPVPEIIEVDREGRVIAFQDLGDLTLYSWMQCRREKEEINKVYEAVLGKVAYLHTQITYEALKEGLSLPCFDGDYFLWESRYFLKECVESFFRLRLNDLGESFESRLSEELNFIAVTLSSSKRVMLHRDLQSQNIMLKDNDVYFIDFQSSRWGPPCYDLASLLWDPYVDLDNSLRESLIEFYLKAAKDFGFCNFDSHQFSLELQLCRIQRHMQALGAYGFLSLRRKKREFSRFIPRGVRLLWQDLMECKIDLSALKELTETLLGMENPALSF